MYIVRKKSKKKHPDAPKHKTNKTGKALHSMKTSPIVSAPCHNTSQDIDITSRSL